MFSFETKQTRCSTFSAVVTSGSIVTDAGSRRISCASFTIGGARVAEKNNDWRRFVSIATMRCTSRRKPISNIRSTSSRTKNSTSDRSMKRWFTRSSKRPGQATSTSTPSRIAWTCGRWPTPPKTSAWRIRMWLPYVSRLLPTWVASSRVGVSTRTRAVFGRIRRGSRCSASRIGSENAAVLPVPVCAQPSKSRPCNSRGIAWAWIGEGVV